MLKSSVISLLKMHHRGESRDVKSAVAIFKNGLLTLQTIDLRLQLLNFLLFGRQRFSLRRNAIALLLQLFNPAPQDRLPDTDRTAGFDRAIALIQHQGGGLALEFGCK